MEDTLRDFARNSSQHTLKIPIDASGLTQSLPESERQKLSVDVFKYIVYEQAEEIGEDEWTAVKEPSEFLDECVVAVYKPGHVPKEVLDSMNQGDLPDELKQQQQAVQQAKMREMAKKNMKEQLALQKKLLGKPVHEDEMAVLNVVKRDRRTIEELQREKTMDNAKRGRYE